MSEGEIPRTEFKARRVIDDRAPLEAFRAALREHGYDEGRNLSLEHRYVAG